MAVLSNTAEFSLDTSYESSINLSSILTTDTVIATDNVTNTTTMIEPATNSPYARYGSIKQFTSYWVGVWVNRTYLRVLNAIGVPGNIAALVTVMRLKPFTSTSLYIAFLAVVDTIALVIYLIYDEIIKADVHFTDLVCRLTMFVLHSTIMMSNWILSCMTIERFIATWFPLLASRICTKKKALIVIAIITTFCVALNMHFLITLEAMTAISGNSYCGPRNEFKNFISGIWYYIDCVVFSLIPCMTVIVFNGLILFKLKKSVNMQIHSNQNREQLLEIIKQQHQTTAMLLTVSTAFVVLTLPNGIYYIYMTYWVPSTRKERADSICLDQIIRCLSTMNHALNFYFYFLAGRKYRGTFLSLFSCFKTTERHPYAISSHSMMSSSPSNNVSCTSTTSASVTVCREETTF